MSNNNYPALNRITLIRDYGLNRYHTKEEFIEYLDRNEHFISPRTLNRDFDFLRKLGYDVHFNHHEKKFIIDDSLADKNNLLDRAKELEYLNTIKSKYSIYYKKYVIDDESKVEGLEYLNKIFKAIDEKLTITFDYHKFNGPKDIRLIAPLQLKVSQNRWYVIGSDLNKNALRVFGLDRIKNLQHDKGFEYKDIPKTVIEELNLQKYYLGITKRIIREEKKIIVTLGVSEFLIEYWKSKPIHFTQKITGKKQNGYHLVEFLLVPNIDLVKLIASSFGEVKLIEPNGLKKIISDKYSASLEL